MTIDVSVVYPLGGGGYGVIGQTTVITGAGLSAATQVHFGGVSQPFTDVGGDLHVVLTSAAKSGNVVVSNATDRSVYPDFVVGHYGPLSPAGADSSVSAPVLDIDGRTYWNDFIVVQHGETPPDLNHPFGALIGTYGSLIAGWAGLSTTSSAGNAAFSWKNGVSRTTKYALELESEGYVDTDDGPAFAYRFAGYSADQIYVPIPSVPPDPDVLDVVYVPPTLLGWRFTANVEWQAGWEGLHDTVGEASAHVGKWPYGDYTEGYSGPPLYDPMPAALPQFHWHEVADVPAADDTWTEFTPDPGDTALLDSDRLPYDGWRHTLGVATATVTDYGTHDVGASVVFEVPIDRTTFALDMSPVSTELDASNGRWVPRPDYNAYVHFTNDTPVTVVHGYFSQPVAHVTAELLFTPPRYRQFFAEPFGSDVPLPITGGGGGGWSIGAPAWG